MVKWNFPPAKPPKPLKVPGMRNKKVSCVYVKLSDGQVVHTQAVGTTVLIDWGAGANEIVGVEVLTHDPFEITVDGGKLHGSDN
jgi:hypothetical protein